jgi:hypothetical protein
MDKRGVECLLSSSSFIILIARIRKTLGSDRLYENFLPLPENADTQAGIGAETSSAKKPDSLCERSARNVHSHG